MNFDMSFDLVTPLTLGIYRVTREADVSLLPGFERTREVRLESSQAVFA